MIIIDKMDCKEFASKMGMYPSTFYTTLKIMKNTGLVEKEFHNIIKTVKAIKAMIMSVVKSYIDNTNKQFCVKHVAEYVNHLLNTSISRHQIMDMMK